jgi:hypothetical protein
MNSPNVWLIWGLAATVVTVLFRTVIIAYLRRPKPFAVPVVGADTGDINTLKGRYVQEADALLREGYEKVSYPRLPLSAFWYLI